MLHLADAVKSSNKFDLSRSHQTTLNFGQIVPIFHEELVPGDKFNVHPSVFSRCAPLVVPTYGKASLKTLNAFVPYHQVAVDADAFMSGLKTLNGIPVHNRYITFDQLFAFFSRFESQSISYKEFLASSLVVPQLDADEELPQGWTDLNSISDSPLSGRLVFNVDEVDPHYDFKARVENMSVQLDIAESNVRIDGDYSGEIRFAFTPFGKYVYKVMRSLGYQIPVNVNEDVSSFWSSTISKKRLSAYPVLAFAKLYNDWMSQSQRYNYSQLSNFLQTVYLGQRNFIYSGGTAYDYATGEISVHGLSLVFKSLRLMYENDYFTSAWEEPNRPLNFSVENVNKLGFPNLAGSQSDVTSGPAGTYVSMDGSPSVGTVISQRSLDFLKSFDNWVRRNNYAGSRDVQQVYSRFGIKTDDYRCKYPYVIGTDTIPLSVGDVTSTAQTSGSDGAVLGEYAGKGIISGDSHFEFKASDFGMLFVLGWITVKPVYADGFDKACLRNSELDYFNPEFDAVGPEAISEAELTSNNKLALASANPDKTFGFTERYNSYKFGHDQITGDFCIDDDFKAWHFGRELVPGDVNLEAQNGNFVSYNSEDTQYNRIFSVTTNDEDKFYLTCYFNVTAYRPMKNLSESANLGTGDTQVERGGNVIN